VSIQPDEDPFSPLAIHLEQAEQEAEAGEEEWMRVSEDSIGVSEGEGGAYSGLAVPEKVVRRSPSFLKTIWDKKLSRSTSVSSLQSLKNKISNPILRTDPPRIAPLRSRASLVSFGEATTISNMHQSVQEEEGEMEDTQHAANSTRSDWLAPPSFTSYPSGSQSLRSKSPVTRNSVLDHPSCNQALGPGGRRLRKPQTLKKSASFDVRALPPTTSAKAFTLLGGAASSREPRRKAERPAGELSPLHLFSVRPC
jgi:hypothetical protein